jgi:hypothetical protein
MTWSFLSTRHPGTADADHRCSSCGSAAGASFWRSLRTDYRLWRRRWRLECRGRLCARRTRRRRHRLRRLAGHAHPRRHRVGLEFGHIGGFGLGSIVVGAVVGCSIGSGRSLGCSSLGSDRRTGRNLAVAGSCCSCCNSCCSVIGCWKCLCVAGYRFGCLVVSCIGS